MGQEFVCFEFRSIGIGSQWSIGFGQQLGIGASLEPALNLIKEPNLPYNIPNNSWFALADLLGQMKIFA